MSDDFFSDDYEDDLNEEPAPRGNGLRQFAESQKQRADALEQRLAAIEAERQKEQFAERLKASGVSNPEALGKYAGLINPDEASDFLAAVKAAMGLEVPAEDAPVGVSPEEQAALAAVSGEPAGAAPVTTGDAAARLDGIDNEADFWATIRGGQ